MSTITLAALTRAVGSATPAAAIATDWNGVAGDVDMAKPADHTTDYGKICIGTTGFNLKQTLEYLMWVAQSKPQVTTAVTQEHLDEAMPYIKVMIARYRVYKIFHAATVEPSFRDADKIDYSTLPTPALQTRFVAELHAMLVSAGTSEGELAETGQMVLFSIVANAIHREQNEDHSWFTDDQDKKKSPTAKTLQVAGRLREKFAGYMRKHGHDGNHHLTKDSLHAMAMILSKMHSGPVIPTSLMYCGADIVDRTVGDVFNLGLSVEGRYPAGGLGKAALIIGLQMQIAMMGHLQTKVLITNAAGLAENAAKLVSNVQTVEVPHNVLLKIGAALGPVFATSYGYLTKSKVLDEETYLAFTNHAKRYPHAVTAGEGLAQAMKSTQPHPEALTGSIHIMLNQMNEAFANVAAVKVLGGSAPADFCGSLEVVKTDEIKATTGFGLGGQGIGQAFYDASA